MLRLHHGRFFLRLALVFFFTASAGAQDKDCPDHPKQGELLCFDHAAGVDLARSVKVADGKTITVRIKNTCPDKFNYSITEVLAEAPATPRARSRAEEVGCTPQIKTMTIQHDKRYGGYLIGLKKKMANEVVKTTEGTVLNDLQLIISVETSAWNVDTYGGFTFSGLTHPKFGIEMRDVMVTDSNTGMTTTEQKPFVIRDSDAEDDVNLGLAAFAHLHHRNIRYFALTFGLGISEENDTTYYTGLSWRFGARGALTVGYAWGEIDRLPAGTDFDKPVAADLLSNLDTKIKGDFFFSYSFSFIDIRDRLQKPFAGSKPQTTGTDNNQNPNTNNTNTNNTINNPPVSNANPPIALKAIHCSSSEVQLSWPAVQNAASYVVRRSAQSCAALAEPTTVTTLTFKDSRVLPVSQYHYDVTAKKADGTVLTRSNCITAFTPPQGIITPACHKIDG